MTTKYMGGTVQMGKSKIALVDHLHAISEINVKIDLEKNQKIQNVLVKSKNSRIKYVQKLIPYLKSVGKLSDKEMISLMSLDLMKMKNFKMKFNLGGY